MKLTVEQSRKILTERGIGANEACDKCGRLLEHVRFTRRNEPGEWCSRECRDGLTAEKVYGQCLGCGVPDLHWKNFRRGQSSA